MKTSRSEMLTYSKFHHTQLRDYFCKLHHQIDFKERKVVEKTNIDFHPVIEQIDHEIKKSMESKFRPTKSQKTLLPQEKPQKLSDSESNDSVS